MHQAIARLGVPADATVLEPGCGTGNFMGHAAGRACGSSASSWIASPAASPAPCTRSTTSASRDFRDTKLPEGSIDAVIGNPPFADVRLDYRGKKLPLHDFFIAKSLDALKPGGVLALVTSHFTLDKQNAATREYLADQADFLGAIRLPSDAFKREGTVGRHRHRVPAQTCQRARQPTTPTPTGWPPRRWPIEGVDVPINRYFLNHPGDGAGRLEPQGHALRRRAATASSATATWPTQLDAAIGRLPEVARHRSPQRRTAEPATRFHPAAARAAHRRGQFLRRRRPDHPPGRRRPAPARSPMAARCSRPTAR